MYWQFDRLLEGISAFIRPVSSETAEPKEVFSSHTLHVEGLDQAGIVYNVSRYLADNNINIAIKKGHLSKDKWPLSLF